VEGEIRGEEGTVAVLWAWLNSDLAGPFPCGSGKRTRKVSVEKYEFRGSWISERMAPKKGELLLKRRVEESPLSQEAR